MRYYGDIELVDSSIINCVIDPIETLPSFVTTDEGRIIYNLADHQLYLNNGSDYFPIQLASQNSEPLIQTLGNIWINPDLSFDPTPFNNLPFLAVPEPLTSTDSLYVVIERITTALSDISAITINDVSPFNVNAPQAGQILYFDGEHFTNVSITAIPNFNINLSLNDLTDVGINGTPSDNQALFFDHTINNGQGSFVNKNWMYVYENNNAQSSYTIVHNLGQLYCDVSVFNTANGTQITPTSVTMNNTEQLTVTLASPVPVIIYVTTIPVQNG